MCNRLILAIWVVGYMIRAGEHFYYKQRTCLLKFTLTWKHLYGKRFYFIQYFKIFWKNQHFLL